MSGTRQRPLGRSEKRAREQRDAVHAHLASIASRKRDPGTGYGFPKTLDELDALMPRMLEPGPLAVRR